MEQPFKRQVVSAAVAERVLWSAWVLAGAAVVVYAVKTGQQLEYEDEKQYLSIATNFAHGDGYALNPGPLPVGDGYFSSEGPTASRPPTWPVLLAALVALGAPLWVLSAVPALLLVAASALARLIARKLAGPTAGWIAAFGLLLYPINIYTAATLYPQMLATVLLLGALVIRLVPARITPAGAGLYGLLLILLVYAVPTMLLVAVLLAGWACWSWRHRMFALVLPALLAGALPALIWTARNEATFDAFVPVSTTTGVNLLLGNSPGATASSGTAVDIQTALEQARARGYNEVQASNYYSGLASDWVRAQPTSALGLYFKKAVNYFSPYNAPVTPGQGGNGARAVAWMTFGGVALLAMARLVVHRQFPLRPGEGIVYALFLLNPLFMAVTFTRVRFRQPLDCLLVIEAAVFAAIVIALAVKRRGRQLKGDDGEASKAEGLQNGGGVA